MVRRHSSSYPLSNLSLRIVKCVRFTFQPGVQFTTIQIRWVQTHKPSFFFFFCLACMSSSIVLGNAFPTLQGRGHTSRKSMRLAHRSESQSLAPPARQQVLSTTPAMEGAGTQ